LQYTTLFWRSTRPQHGTLLEKTICRSSFGDENKKKIYQIYEVVLEKTGSSEVGLGHVFGKEKTICRWFFAKQLRMSGRSCCFICREKKYGSICIRTYILTYTYMYTCTFFTNPLEISGRSCGFIYRNGSMTGSLKS